MEALGPDPLPYRIDALPKACDALAEVLHGGGLTSEEAVDLFRLYVAAECLECGMQVRGGELRKLATPRPAGTKEDPRLSRMREGCCARKTCEAHYYKLVFDDHPKMDWNQVAAALSSAFPPEPPPAADELEPRASLFGLLLDRRYRRVVIGIGILLVLLVIRHFATGGRIPVFQRAPKYTLDPTSIQEKPLEEASPSPATNR